MAITLRNTKGDLLTWDELDGNFTDLNTRLTTLSTTVGSVTSTQISYLSDVTSNIQTQLNSKLSSVPAATSTTYGGVKVSLSGTTLTITV